MQSATAKDAFTPEQVVWLEKRINAAWSQAERGFDKATLMWIIGGLTALGVAASAFLYNEIGSVRDELRTEIGTVRDELRAEIGTVRDELRVEIGTVRTQVSDNRASLARIEAILNERLPRNE